jgi:hypothetical protein
MGTTRNLGPGICTPLGPRDVLSKMTGAVPSGFRDAVLCWAESIALPAAAKTAAVDARTSRERFILKPPQRTWGIMIEKTPGRQPESDRTD